jgi:hypothetical protein
MDDIDVVFASETWQLLRWAEFFFTWFFAAEMLLKIHALGPRMYFDSGWNILDAVIALTSLLNFAILYEDNMGVLMRIANGQGVSMPPPPPPPTLVVGGAAATQLQDSPALTGLRSLRALRPLRTLSRVPGLQVTPAAAPPRPRRIADATAARQPAAREHAPPVVVQRRPACRARPHVHADRTCVSRSGAGDNHRHFHPQALTGLRALRLPLSDGEHRGCPCHAAHMPRTPCTPRMRVRMHPCICTAICDRRCQAAPLCATLRHHQMCSPPIQAHAQAVALRGCPAAE